MIIRLIVRRHDHRVERAYVQPGHGARAFIGTAEQAVAYLKRFTDMGVSQFMTVFPDQDEHRSLRLFADHIVPRV